MDLSMIMIRQGKEIKCYLTFQSEGGNRWTLNIKLVWHRVVFYYYAMKML